MSPDRIPCDACRQRRIRCDGLLPCAGCQRSDLICTRDYVRKRRGPKCGHGKKIAALRAAQRAQRAQSSSGEEESREKETPQPTGIPNTSNAASVTAVQVRAVQGPEKCTLPEDLTSLMRRCVEVYLDQLYPIMPVIRPSELRSWLERSLRPNEHSMLLALCAMVTAFLCGRSQAIVGDVEWEPVARFFVQKSLAERSLYSFVDDPTVISVLGSFFLAVTYFELHEDRRSWFYLREAITLAQALGLHTEHYYHGMSPVDALYCRRIHDILFVTERSFAVSRHKPVLLSHPLPAGRTGGNECEEQPEVDRGFRQLVQVYSQLDSEFLTLWSREGWADSGSLWTTGGIDFVLRECGAMPETQKADIYVTQHWLDLAFWRAALQQGLLSSTASSRSRLFSYPEDIALSLLGVLSSLPTESVEAHGLGIVSPLPKPFMARIADVRSTKRSMRSARPWRT